MVGIQDTVGLCYILSMTNLRSEPGGLRGVGSLPLWGPGQCPGKFFFGPYIRLGRPTYGFRSMVLDAMVFSPWYWILRHV